MSTRPRDQLSKWSGFLRTLEAYTVKIMHLLDILVIAQYIGFH